MIWILVRREWIWYWITAAICYVRLVQVLVGKGLKGDGLMWDEQREILKQFNSGTTRLVISTTVLEEGLDVTTCNLVVRFSAPSSYRQFIQSRGRACRSSNGVFAIICQTLEEQKNQIDYSKTEDKMIEAIRNQMRRAPSTQDQNLVKRTPDMHGDFKRMDSTLPAGSIGVDLSDDSDEDDSDDDEIVQVSCCSYHVLCKCLAMFLQYHTLLENSINFISSFRVFFCIYLNLLA